jgi:RimJ/RimL family protein N-acetyltransferase
VTIAGSGAAARIPLDGVLFEGQCVRIGWPELTEFDAITELRNRSGVRRQFLDSRPLDLEQNRRWLSEITRRPHDALLAIRLKPGNRLVGTIGWTDWNPIERSIEVGRIMVDTRMLAECRDALPADHPGVALDAGLALRDFAFRTLGVDLLRTKFIADNRLAKRLNLAVGGRIVTTSVVACADGRRLKVAHVDITRDDWLKSTNAGREVAPASSETDSRAGVAAHSSAP